MAEEQRTAIVGDRDLRELERRSGFAHDLEPFIGPRVEIAGEENRTVMIAEGADQRYELRAIAGHGKREVDRVDVDDGERLIRTCEVEP